MLRRIVLACSVAAALLAVVLLLVRQPTASAIISLMAVAASFELLREHGLLRRAPASVGLSPEDRVIQVLDLNGKIEALAKQVHSTRLQTALIHGCSSVPQIMAHSRQKDPDNLATTAAKVGVYLQSVHTALDQYITMQNHPGPDTPAQLYADGKVLEGFPEFVRTSQTQLEAGDIAVYRANLKVLQPMTTKGISGNI